MAQATTISLSQFTSAVQAAVKAAVQKHPKFRLEAPSGIAVSYLIRGIPVPEPLLSHVTLAEAQAFADDVAGHVAGAHPQAFAAAATAARPRPHGAVISVGGHVILGFPPMPDAVMIEK